MRRKRETKRVNWSEANIFAKYCNYIWMTIPFMVIIWLVKMCCIDTDSYFLAATGRYILESGEIPKISPFVIHSDFQLIVQQWVVCVLNYVLYEGFGLMGMLIWSFGTLVVTETLIYKYLSLFTDNTRVKLYAMLLCSILIMGFCNVRPTSISMNILLAEMIVLERFWQDKSKRSLIALPFLSLGLINCHAAMWLMMFVLMLPYLVPGLKSILSIKEVKNKFNNDTEYRENFKLDVSKRLQLFTWAAISFMFGTLNPNGLKGMLYTLYSYGGVSNDNFISEMKSATVFSIWGALIILSAVVIALYIYKFRSELQWDKVYLALGTWLLAAKNLRSTWMLVIGTAPLLVMLVQDCIGNTVKMKYKPKDYKILALAYTIALGTVLVMVTPGIQIRNTTDSDKVPVLAADYLDSLPEDEKDDIVLYTGFNNGSYMEWRGYKVYLDSRAESFLKKLNGVGDILDEYKKVLKGTADYSEFLSKYNFTHLVVSEPTLQIYMNCQEDTYRKVVETDKYIMYERI